VALASIMKVSSDSKNGQIIKNLKTALVIAGVSIEK
jgi:hypothetical protein